MITTYLIIVRLSITFSEIGYYYLKNISLIFVVDNRKIPISSPPPHPTQPHKKKTTPFSKGFGRSAGLSLNTIKRRIIIFSPYCLNKGSFGGVFTDHLHSIPKRRRVNSNNKQTTMEMKTFRVFFFALLLLASPLLQGPPFLISGSRSVHARPHFFDSFHDFVDTIVLIFYIN